uniref:collagen alpha-1(III) chain-like n=1 Tax=Nyctereutes procyonoides TaxID=34880 RepID=UPI002444F61B|nr:collagen alpha-1(III) chain-like [Nyctereutes procyonoides]
MGPKEYLGKEAAEINMLLESPQRIWKAVLWSLQRVWNLGVCRIQTAEKVETRENSQSRVGKTHWGKSGEAAQTDSEDDSCSRGLNSRLSPPEVGSESSRRPSPAPGLQETTIRALPPLRSCNSRPQGQIPEPENIGRRPVDVRRRPGAPPPAPRVRLSSRARRGGRGRSRPGPGRGGGPFPRLRLRRLLPARKRRRSGARARGPTPGAHPRSRQVAAGSEAARAARVGGGGRRGGPGEPCGPGCPSGPGAAGAAGAARGRGRPSRTLVCPGPAPPSRTGLLGAARARGRGRGPRPRQPGGGPRPRAPAGLRPPPPRLRGSGRLPASRGASRILAGRRPVARETEGPRDRDQRASAARLPQAGSPSARRPPRRDPPCPCAWLQGLRGGGGLTASATRGHARHGGRGGHGGARGAERARGAAPRCLRTEPLRTWERAAAPLPPAPRAPGPRFPAWGPAILGSQDLSAALGARAGAASTGWPRGGAAAAGARGGPGRRGGWRSGKRGSACGPQDDPRPPAPPRGKPRRPPATPPREEPRSLPAPRGPQPQPQQTPGRGPRGQGRLGRQAGATLFQADPPPSGSLRGLPSVSLSPEATRWPPGQPRPFTASHRHLPGRAEPRSCGVSPAGLGGRGPQGEPTSAVEAAGVTRPRAPSRRRGQRLC